MILFASHISFIYNFLYVPILNFNVKIYVWYIKPMKIISGPIQNLDKPADKQAVNNS